MKVHLREQLHPRLGSSNSVGRAAISLSEALLGE
jgi:hypothetical protein